MRRTKTLAGTLILSAALAALASCSSLPRVFGKQPEVEANFTKTALPEGVELVDVYAPAKGEIGIPYEKYVLPNGLTLILSEDHSDPIVHVDVTYHVGSAREEPGRSGFAHFFEHMMFQGSEHVDDEEHFKIVSEAGGTLNGSTNADRTNYYETLPANQLEKALWLEADRMGFLLPAVTETKFENQRATVKNERGQNYDNRPYGLLFEKVAEAMYPQGHPYSWSTIGYIEDLDRATLADLKNFFLRWYGPNNAVLTIGGDIDKRQTLEWVAKYFSPIPRGPDVAPPEYVPVALDKDRYISMQDNVASPLIFMAFPTVNARHPDEAPLDVLMSIMGDGRTSLFYKNLIKTGMAVSANAGHGCQELSCMFSLMALPNPATGATLADLEAGIRKSLEEFETRGVQDDDIERVKADIVSGMVFNLESVAGKTTQLAFYQTFAGDPGWVDEDIARYRNVAKDDVMRVYRQYIKDQPAVIMSIVPMGQPDAVAHPDTWTMYERSFPETAGADLNLALREPVDTFDRSVQPPAGDTNPAPVLPETWRATLANGVDILGAVNAETPTTALTVRIEAGQRNEPLDKLGLSSLTAQMLGESTKLSTNEELSNRLAKLGSSLSIHSGERFTTLTVHSLSENLAATVDILAERLMEPAFAADDFARLKDQRLQDIEQVRTDADATADTVYSLLLFGRDNPSSYDGLGSPETLSRITLDDVKSFYETHMTAGATTITAVSDLSKEALTEALAPLNDLTGKAASPASPAPFPETGKGVLYLVDKKDAAQSEIRVGMRSLPYDATGEYYRARLMNFALGGAFNSRINLNLREDKGWTYGARTGFSGDDVKGTFTASTGVRTDATAGAISEILKEIRAYAADGPTAAELAFTKSAIGQSDARKYETPFDKLGLLADMQVYDLPDNFIETQKAILAGLPLDENAALARSLLPVDDMIVVVVGDAGVVRPELDTLGYRIVELDAEGSPLGPESTPRHPSLKTGN